MLQTGEVASLFQRHIKKLWREIVMLLPLCREKALAYPNAEGSTLANRLDSCALCGGPVWRRRRKRGMLARRYIILLSREMASMCREEQISAHLFC